MRFFNYLVILTLYFVYCRCEDKLEEENKEKLENREGKQLLDKVEHGGWRTINPPDWTSSDEWVPTNNHPVTVSEYVENPTMRRRRIRKRKRRPPLEAPDSLSIQNPNVRLPTLEDADELWMEMEDEPSASPHSRRRIVPVYLSDVDEQPNRSQIYEKVRDPFTALEEAEAKSKLKKKTDTHETSTISNLKAILKQTGGSLNLSELLQRKNLSLADLLHGKQHAISALTEKVEVSTEPLSAVTHRTTKSPNAITKSTNRNYEVIDDTSQISKDVIYTQAQNDIGYKGLSTIKNYEVITEPTTEKRIFVPSYPKIVPFNYKHSTVKITTTSEPTITTTSKNTSRNKYLDYRMKYVSIKPKLQNSLPLTSAKLHKSSNSVQIKTTDTVTTPTPLKAFTIDLKDLFGFPELIKSNVQPKEDVPLKMVINMENIIQQSTEHSVTTIKSVKTAETPLNAIETIFKNLPKEKLKASNAREEIMEVLKDQRSRQNLSRILQRRNMTIEELVAQRERGSSQLHLADIFHNQTKEPDPPNEPYVGIITSNVQRKSKTLQNTIVTAKNFEASKYISGTNLKPNFQNDSDQKQTYTVTSFPTYKIAVDKILKQNQTPPFQLSVWKTLYPNLHLDNSLSDMKTKEVVEDNAAKVDEIFNSDLHRIEDVENTISEAVNHKLDVELDDNYENGDTLMRLPSGVKSAIIASTALVAISLLIFLTILIICKWSHKKKRRLCYSDVYSGSRIKSPILDTRPKRTIRTIMNETLGRKKNYSNVYPHNISDYFWESDKKPFQ